VHDLPCYHINEQLKFDLLSDWKPKIFRPRNTYSKNLPEKSLLAQMINPEHTGCYMQMTTTVLWVAAYGTMLPDDADGRRSMACVGPCILAWSATTR
jgi:hypothetical protein